MVSLWHGHEFEGDELETWSQEIAAAALDVLPDQRTAFVEAGCAGSEPLLHRVNGLLENSFQERSEPPIDSACRPGEILSGCFLLGNLGRGGTADVYKAIQLPLKRIVAVKVLRDVGLIESSNLAREATRLSSLHHDNIVTVYNADFGCEKPCMVMEFVDGITLREWIRRQHEDLQCPPSGVIKSIVVQVLAGLGAAHRQGLVHRDIKPENILLSAKADGQRFHVKVTDFGLARRLDAAGKGVGGTAGYIAPEQFFGASPDARSDLFSVGVVLYEMLTGVHPFVGKSDAETWYNTIHTDPCFPPEGAFDRYREILQKALSKTPEERYDSTEEMVRALGEGAPEPLELNPLLSEFPDAIRRWADQAGAGFWMAVGSFTWGAVSLVLSVLCNAACLRVLWAAESGRGLAETIYGYAVEFNAGPWYLAGASACALAGIGFLQAAHRGLAATLKVTDGFSSTDPQPLSRVAEKNRRWFRILTPFALFAAACLVLIPEMGMREKNAFGWVQADMAETYLNVDYDQLRSDKKVGDLHSVRALCPICPVRVTHVSNRFSGYRQPSKVLFGVFLAFALAHQVILSAFVNFLAFKVVFFFWILGQALLGSERGRIRVILDLDDRDDFRLGLGRLDNVYYAVLFMLSLGSLAGLMQAATNLNKGTYFFLGRGGLELIGQPLTMLLIVAILGSIILVPMTMFLFITLRIVNRHLAELSSRRRELFVELEQADSAEAQARIHQKIADLRERRDIVRRQTILPARTMLFRGLVAFNLFLIVSPAILTTRTASDVANHMTRLLCSACGNAPVRP